MPAAKKEDKTIAQTDYTLVNREKDKPSNLKLTLVPKASISEQIAAICSGNKGLRWQSGDLMVIDDSIYIKKSGWNRLANYNPTYAGMSVEITEKSLTNNWVFVKAMVWKKGIEKPFEDISFCGSMEKGKEKMEFFKILGTATTRAQNRALRNAFTPNGNVAFDDLDEDDQKKARPVTLEEIQTAESIPESQIEQPPIIESKPNTMTDAVIVPEAPKPKFGSKKTTSAAEFKDQSEPKHESPKKEESVSDAELNKLAEEEGIGKEESKSEPSITIETHATAPLEEHVIPKPNDTADASIPEKKESELIAKPKFGMKKIIITAQAVPVPVETKKEEPVELPPKAVEPNGIDIPAEIEKLKAKGWTNKLLNSEHDRIAAEYSGMIDEEAIIAVLNKMEVPKEIIPNHTPATKVDIIHTADEKPLYFIVKPTPPNEKGLQSAIVVVINNNALNSTGIRCKYVAAEGKVLFEGMVVAARIKGNKTKVLDEVETISDHSDELLAQYEVLHKKLDNKEE